MKNEHCKKLNENQTKKPRIGAANTAPAGTGAVLP